VAEALGQAGFAIARGAIFDGLASAEWPGRLELIAGAPPVLLDGAHNTAGAAALRPYLDEVVSGPVTLVFGAMSDKEVGPMLGELAPAAKAIVLTRPRSPRALPPAALAAALSPDLEPILTESVDEAIDHALRATPSDGMICVAGSLYLVGEAKSALATHLENQP
jgi:dihydrofolate synthase/folylpolyglutamate synthase